MKKGYGSFFAREIRRGNLDGRPKPGAKQLATSLYRLSRDHNVMLPHTLIEQNLAMLKKRELIAYTD